MPFISANSFYRATNVLSALFDRTGPINGAAAFRNLAVAAAGMAALTLGMLIFDTRTLSGEPVWLKPFKFAISFGILFATIGFVAGRLSDRWQTNAFIGLAVVAAGAAFAFEMSYIGAQAAQAEPSHFNETTAFHERMYSLMGLGASGLMAAIATVGFAAWFDRRARLGDATRLAIVAGFLGTVVLTLFVAGELAGNGSRYIGIPTEGGPRLPVLGWSMEVGDLRPAHFLSLHMMQALPLLGLLADRRHHGVGIIVIGATLYAAMTLLVYLQAVRGLPLLGA
ncbi:MAG: hypothetical protein O9309_20110 [Rhizobium sp.]|nr:hypothetical protein [Rhizobium sp.]MCZ8352050.1 hypothetical protein [Rhizobium sp.]